MRKDFPIIERELTFAEIERRGLIERKIQIDNYFNFVETELQINENLKNNMPDEGGWIEFQPVHLSLFPSIIADLLKFKKHEWIIVAFEKNKIIDLMWANKGDNSESVSLKINDWDILGIVNEHEYQTVLFFHNHPNHKPYLYNMLTPSEADLAFIKRKEVFFNPLGINVLSFVCERGRYECFYLGISDSFLSVKEMLEKEAEAFLEQAEKNLKIGDLESTNNLYKNFKKAKPGSIINKFEEVEKFFYETGKSDEVNQIIQIVSDFRCKLKGIIEKNRIELFFGKDFENKVEEAFDFLESKDFNSFLIKDYKQTIRKIVDIETLLELLVISREKKYFKRYRGRLFVISKVEKILKISPPNKNDRECWEKWKERQSKIP